MSDKKQTKDFSGKDIIRYIKSILRIIKSNIA